MQNIAPASLRLWTFQSLRILLALQAGQIHRAAWDTTSPNFRASYRWMAARLAAQVGAYGTQPPIWCWHSCWGRRGAPPTVLTADLLLSQYQLDEGMFTLALDVPTELMLLSSYWAWNEFLEYAITRKRVPTSRRLAQAMFEEPLFKRPGDDIQAVIPWIDPAWVVGVAPLSLAGRSCDERIVVRRRSTGLQKSRLHSGRAR